MFTLFMLGILFYGIVCEIRWREVYRTSACRAKWILEGGIFCFVALDGLADTGDLGRFKKSLYCTRW